MRMQKIVVSLTSYPRRINIVNMVIESLWMQDICPDEIVLYLSASEFPQKEKNLPDKLVEMIGKNGFKIEWEEGNLKSHKKYYYALKENDDKAIIITVDDDIIYSRTLISDLLCSYQKFPGAISARRTRIILKEGENLAKYIDWNSFFGELTCEPRMDLCAIGVGGVLYPPNCAGDRWFDKENIQLMAENQDDLWLKYNEIVDCIPVVYVKPTQEDKLIESAKEAELCTNNMFGGQNDVSIDKLNKWLEQDYKECYSTWFSGLIQKEDYIDSIKSYYFNRVQDAFNKMKDLPLYLYGAGKRAKAILKILVDFGMINRVEAIIVSNKKENPDMLHRLKVKQIDEMDKLKPFGVIFGVGNAYRDEIIDLLKDYECICLDLDIKGIYKYYTN